MQIRSKKTQVNPLAAGVTGLVLGAAGAAAVVLSDEGTRKKAKQKAVAVKNDLHKWGSKKVKDLQQRGEALKVSEKQMLEKGKQDLQAKIKDTVDDPKKN